MNLNNELIAHDSSLKDFRANEVTLGIELWSFFPQLNGIYIRRLRSLGCLLRAGGLNSVTLRQSLIFSFEKVAVDLG